MSNLPTPPRWADRLLRLVCAPHRLEEVQGDLHEEFAWQVRRIGLQRARWRYWRDVLGFMKPFAMKRKQQHIATHSMNRIMIHNYVKIAWRSLLKNKLYSSINIFGLALGMACSLLIGLWVRDELSYNRFLTDADNIFFVRINTEYRGEIFTNENTPGPLATTIKKDIPEIAYITKVAPWPHQLLKVGEKAAKERGYYATTDFFDVFQVPALAGDPRVAIANPRQIIITRKLADAYFSNPGQYKQILGKVLQLNNADYYTVGAVIDNIPSTSTLQFDWVVNFRVFEAEWMKDWGNNAFRTYARLNPKTTAAKAEQTMRGIYSRYTKFNIPIAPVLQPITDVYLYSEYKNGKIIGGRYEYVRIFSLVAVFILLVACINFVNLTTARSALRAKEVGIRKVVGALRQSLIGQFLSESALTSLLAAVLALLFVWLALPTFNTLFEKQISLQLTDPTLWLGILALILLTGFLSGSYPALFLSSLQPIRILKGTMRFGTSATRFRQSLVVFQFSLAIFLIVGMIAVGRQIEYIRTKNLGIERENVVAVPLEGELLFKQKEAFRQALLRAPSIISAAVTSELPINIQSTSTTTDWPGKDPTLQPEISGTFVGPDFIKTMNIELVEGRDFRSNSPSDSSSYIINETAAKLMNMKNPIGKEIDFWHGKGPIIGVVKDFHLQSFHQAISPLILAFDNRNTSYLLAKIRPGQTTQALTEIERLSAEFNPNYPFDYQFLDEAYNKLYRSEQQVQTLINYFGLMAILISCLGLFALATFTAEQRTKEIGVRKVLGATVTDIVSLLSKDFLVLVIIAFVLAVPLAWWSLDKWLGTFQYRTALPWWVFAFAGSLAVLIALLTISFQSIKAALMNPVKSLRTE